MPKNGEIMPENAPQLSLQNSYLLADAFTAAPEEVETDLDEALTSAPEEVKTDPDEAITSAPKKVKPDLGKELKSLYDAEPDYALNSGGTIDARKEFTEEEKKELSAYNKQFDLIIKAIQEACRKELEWKDEELLQNLDVFSERMQGRKYYDKQTREFYSQVKKSMECIWFNLKHKKIVHVKDKKRAMSELLPEIINCGSGIYNHIETARAELECQNTLEAWLAKYRKTIIKQLAHEHFKAKNMQERDITHVENVFLNYSVDKGWYPYGYERLSMVNEIHASLAQVGSDDLILFEKKFFERYNPTSIVTECVQCIQSLFTKRIKDKLNEHYKENKKEEKYPTFTQDEFLKIFAGLPIINHPIGLNSLFDIFEETEIKKNATDIQVQDIGILRLKSMNDLKISLIRYFLCSDKHLFQILPFKNFVIVPGDSSLCYSVEKNKPETWPYLEYHDQSSIIPWDQSDIKNIPLAICRDSKLSLNNEQFQHYYELKETDFNDLTLKNVDLTNVALENLTLSDVTLKNVRVSPQQLIYIYRSDFLRSVSVKFDEDYVSDNIEEILALGEDEKGILVFYAIQMNFPGLVRALVDAKANVNRPDHNGFISLHYAAQLGNPEIISILLENGADPGKKNSKGLTTIQFAAYDQKWDCVRILAENTSEINGNLNYGCALLSAARHNQTETVKLLLKQGASTNWNLRVNKFTALHFAAQHGNAEMITLLLNHGADLSEKDSEGSTPIQIAAYNQKWNCVRTLAENTSDINGNLNYGSALLNAAKHNQTEIVKLLLEKGAAMHWALTTNKLTPLHLAVRNGNIEMMRLLIDHGAEPSLKDRDGYTPIQLGFQKAKEIISDSPVKLAILNAIERYYVEGTLERSSTSIFADFYYTSSDVHSKRRVLDMINLINLLILESEENVLNKVMEYSKNIQTGFLGRSYLRTCLQQVKQKLDSERPAIQPAQQANIEEENNADSDLSEGWVMVEKEEDNLPLETIREKRESFLEKIEADTQAAKAAKKAEAGQGVEAEMKNIEVKEEKVAPVLPKIEVARPARRMPQVNADWLDKVAKSANEAVLEKRKQVPAIRNQDSKKKYKGG